MRKYFVFLILIFTVVIIGSGFSYASKPSDFGLKEGDLISAIFSDDPDVYIINDQGYKRLFLNPEIFMFYSHLGGFANVKLVTPEIRDSFPTSGFFRNCEDNDQKVYGTSVEAEDMGRLHWINKSGEQAVQEDPDFFKKVFCINRKEFNWYPRGNEFKELREVPQYHRTEEAENYVICHHPSDDPKTFETIRVAPESLDAHFQHGDTKGACSTSSVQQTFPVDVKINGSDTPASIPYNSVFTVSWTSNGAVSCRDFGQFIPVVDGGVWAKFISLPTSGTKSLYARTESQGYLATLDIQVQCTNVAGQTQDDVIHLSVQPPVAPIPTPIPYYSPTPTPIPIPSYSPTPTPTPSTTISPSPTSSSSYSPTPTVTPTTTITTPAAPSNFKATILPGTLSGVNITLIWTDNANNETGYYLQGTNPSGGQENAYLPANQQSYNGYANMPPGTYSFTLRSYISDNGSWTGNKTFSSSAYVSVTATVPTPTSTLTVQSLVTLTSPNGGECMAGIMPINWSSLLGTEVKWWDLNYSVDNGSSYWYVMWLHSYSARSYNWATYDVIKKSDINSSQALIKARACGGTFPSCTDLGTDISDKVFSINLTCPGGVAPAAPTNLTATPKTYSNGTLAITVNWTDNSSNELGFAAYKRIKGASQWDVPSISTGTGMEYQGLQTGTTYEFMVRAGNQYGYSADSNIATATVGSTAINDAKNSSSNFASISKIITRDLYIGSTGDDVKQLQALLVNEVGYSANLLTGYFGRITRDAVKRLQEKYGIQPTYGYFGAITRKTLNALIFNQ